MNLEGVKSNRSAIGARVIVHYGSKKQVQAVVSQSSYYSCNDPRLHFGLGSVTSIDIEVFWPGGLHENHKELAADQLATLREGVGSHSKQRRGQAIRLVLRAGKGFYIRVHPRSRAGYHNADHGVTPLCQVHE